MWKLLFFVFCLLIGLLLTKVEGKDALIPSSKGQQKATEESQAGIPPGPESFIVGGEEVNITQVPFQVSLRRKGHFCGGSLISNYYVLTAAHCTDGETADGLTVRIGSKHRDSGGELIPVAAIYQHPSFIRFTLDFDFSILKLSRPVYFDRTKQPVKLPTHKVYIVDGEVCSVSGWGETQNATESSEILRAAKVPIVNQQVCAQKYENFNDVTETMICAGLLVEGGKDSCQGDSGGPLVNNYGILIGVVSWGLGCALPNFPGVYSSVPSVRYWIQYITGL